MSTPTDPGYTQDQGRNDCHTVVFTDLALDTIKRMFLHLEQVGEAFKYSSPEYLAESSSLHACLIKVLDARHSPGASFVSASQIHEETNLSLEIEVGRVFVFGMIFFPNKAYGDRAVMPGEYSLHS